MMIKREILSQLISHLPKKEITLLIGPRQAGKTTLLLYLKQYLEKKGEKTVFFNLDFENDFSHFTSQINLLRKIKLEIGESGYVFIDEIQRKENAGLFLKGLYDQNLPYKFIVSGSGALELKEKISESLVGRKRVFYLPTLTFWEFFHFKTNYRYQNQEKEFFATEKEKGKEIFEEYLIFGGYPKVVLARDKNEKLKEMAEIYQSYLEKDISFLLKIKKTESLSFLVKILSGQIGQLVNLNEFANTLGLSYETIKNYLWYLEKTFIIKKLTPFYKNIRKEISKAPVFYFSDLGFRNFVLGLFSSPLLPSDAGFLFQNFVFLHLFQKYQLPFNIHFWRTKDKAEVDFVIEKGEETVAYEVKYQSLKQPKISSSLISFIKKYSPKKVYLINLSLHAQEKLGKTEVEFRRFWEVK